MLTPPDSICISIDFPYRYGEKPVTDSSVSDFDDFCMTLDNNTCFDPIRDSEEFIALYK